MTSRAVKAVFIAAVMVVCAVAVSVPTTQAWFYDESDVSETSFTVLPLVITRADDFPNTSVSSNAIEKEVSEGGSITLSFTNTDKSGAGLMLNVEASAPQGTVVIEVDHTVSDGKGIVLGENLVAAKVTGLGDSTTKLSFVFHITDSDGRRLL